MKIRLQADADLNAAILLAATRREPGMDFQTAQAAKLRSLSDVEVLAVAAREGRVLVTHEDDLKKHEAEARPRPVCAPHDWSSASASARYT